MDAGDDDDTDEDDGDDDADEDDAADDDGDDDNDDDGDDDDGDDDDDNDNNDDGRKMGLKMIFQRHKSAETQVCCHFPTYFWFTATASGVSIAENKWNGINQFQYKKRHGFHYCLLRYLYIRGEGGLEGET